MDFLGSSKVPVPTSSRSSTSSLVKVNSVVNLDYKSFVCPCCNRHYDFQIRNTILFGRVPLVLHCKHTICEECVHNGLAKKIVVCGVCSDTNVIDENDKRKSQQLFYINFYVLGLMLSNKPESVYSKFNLKPSGVNYSNRKRTDLFQPNPMISSISMDFKMPPVVTQQVSCSMFTCSSPATVKCQNCDEILCNNCSTQLHTASKTFMQHTIESLEPATPEINKRCKVHPDSFLDFMCKTCNTELCCYCIVQFHTGHEYEQLSMLESSKASYFESLISKANNVLKIMSSSQKKINTRMQRNQLGVSTTKLEQEISSYFTNLHAALQTVEYRLKMEASMISNNCSQDLLDINQMLSHNTMLLTNLVGMAKSAMSPTNNTKKINMSLITEKLESLVKVPCHFVEENTATDEKLQFKVREDILDRIEENFIITNPELTKYKLLTTEELPEDFGLDETSFSSIGDRSDDDSLFSISDKRKSDLYGSDVCLSSDSTATTDTEKTFNDQRPRRSGEQKESVIVTHINSPQSFFVQFYRNSKSIQNMIRDINMYVRNNCHFLVKDVNINSVYLVRYDQNRNQQWCRGRVVERLEDDVYDVFFIDYGNVEPIKRNLIMNISSELARVAPFAVECKLFNLFPKDERKWETKAVALMAQILTENSRRTIMVTKSKSDGIYEVDLLSVSADGNSTSVREALLYMGYAITYCKTPPIDRKKPKHIRTRMFNKTNTFKVDDNLVVILSHVTEELEVFVQSADFYHQIEILSEKLESYYESKRKHNVIYVPEQDMPVAVKWNNGRKTKWFRGRVVDTLMGGGSVRVYLVDYGATINVNVTTLRKLMENFLPMECQAIKTKLVHIHVMQPDQCMNILQKYVVAQTKLKMVVKNPEEVEVVFFEVFPTYDFCINAFLVQEGAAISTGHLSQKVEWIKEAPKKQSKQAFTLNLIKTIQGSKTSNLNPSQTSPVKPNSSPEDVGIKKPVKILLAESPDLIYVSLEDDNIKKYQNSLHILLQERYPDNSKQKTDWELDDVCVVYNEHSKTYNRAVIKEKEGEKFKVFLCDVGKNITVNLDEMYIIDDMCKKIPNGVIRCHMSGIKPAGDQNKWSRMAVEYLSELVAKENNFCISKSGETDLANKSLAVTLWFQEMTQEGPLEPSVLISHSVNNLLINNGLALRCKKETQTQNLQVNDKTDKVPQEVEDVVQQVVDFNEVIDGGHVLDKRSVGNDVDKENFVDKEDVVNKENVGKHLKKNKHPKRGKFPKKRNPQLTRKEGKIKEIITKDDEEEEITSDSDTKLTNLKSMTSKQYKSQENISVAFEEKELPHSQTSFSENNTPTYQRKSKDESVVDWNELIESQENVIQLAVEETAKPENEIDTDEKNRESSISSVPAVESHISDWLPPFELTKNSFIAVATFVNNHAHIYLHDVDIEPVLKEMEVQMKNVFDNCSPEPLDTVWFVGQMCTVKYFMNDSWYRGKIINITDDSIKVHMIDYGNEEECKHEDLRSKIMFPEIPAIASKICLHNVFAKSEWITSDLDLLHATIVDKQITVTLKGGNSKKNKIVPAVIFVDCLNINQFMLEQSSNLISQRHDKKKQNKVKNIPNDDEDDDVIILTEHSCDESSCKDSVVEVEQNNVKKFTWVPLPDDDVIEVALISVIDYNRLVIELSSSISEERFFEISRELEEEGDDQPRLEHCQNDAACIARFSTDAKWYRAQIVSSKLIESGLVYVWFVDFGNFDTVSIEDVREIKVEWLDFPLLHFIAEINGIELPRGADNEDLLNKIIDNYSEKLHTLKKIEIVERSPLKVNVFESDGSSLMYQDLIDSGDLVYNP